MLFKKTALFFLTLACAILLVHNIVPHSHEHSDDSMSGHHSHSHHHHHDASGTDNDQDVRGSGLADVFSNIGHHDEGITFLLTHNFSNLIAKQILSSAFIIPEHFYLKEFILPPLLHHSPAEFFEEISFVPCTWALRGPPSIAI